MIFGEIFIQVLSKNQKKTHLLSFHCFFLGRINLADVKQKPSTSTSRELDNRKSDRSSPSSRTSRKNTPVRGRKRRSRSSNSSRSTSSSSSSSESSSSSSESDKPYYLDKKREKDRVRREIKRYRKMIGHNRHHSRERRRSPERCSNDRKEGRRRSNSPSIRQPKIIIVPVSLTNEFIQTFCLYIRLIFFFSFFILLR